MTIPERAKKIVDLVFNHAEEHKGLQRTVLERGVEDILLAASARDKWDVLRPVVFDPSTEPEFKPDAVWRVVGKKD
jgi:hypothetical protein